jgi:hypothetical protein
MNTTGSFHRAASDMASWAAPWLTAPSPKKQRVTLPSPLYLEAKAVPVASGRWPPTMPQPPRKLVLASKKCIDPPRPFEQPVSLA